MQCLKVTIYGLVQGVFFREAAKRKARELSLVGFVKNQEDGAVYLEAEGEKNFGKVACMVPSRLGGGSSRKS